MRAQMYLVTPMPSFPTFVSLSGQSALGQAYANCGRQPLEEMQPKRPNRQKPPFAAFVGQLYMLMCA